MRDLRSLMVLLGMGLLLLGVGNQGWALPSSNAMYPPPPCLPPCPPPCPVPCPAPCPCPPKEWAQSFSVYLWVPGVHGNVIVRGVPADADISIHQTWKSLINDFNGGFVGHYEASRARWSFFADLLYINLKQTHTTRFDVVEVNPRQTIGELGAAYVLSPLPSCDPNTPYVTEVIGGVRYTDLSADLSLQNAGIGVSGSKSWADPFIGLRSRQELHDGWFVSERADIGGWSSGNTNFTWNVVLLAGYATGPQWNFDLGWRWLGYDYDTGSGASEFKYDVTYSGPILSATYLF